MLELTLHSYLKFAISYALRAATVSMAAFFARNRTTVTSGQTYVTVDEVGKVSFGKSSSAIRAMHL
jgi:hypothetical protein